MVQVINTSDPRKQVADMIGSSLGMGLSEGINTYRANKALEEVLQDPSLKEAPFSEKASKLQQALSKFGEYGDKVLQRRVQIEQQSQIERDQQIVGNYLSGGMVSTEDFQKLSPKTQMAVMQHQQKKSSDKIASEAFGAGYKAIQENDPAALANVISDPMTPLTVKTQLTSIANQKSLREDVKARETRNRVQNVQSAYAKAITAEKARIGKYGGYTKAQIADINKKIEELEAMRQSDMQALLNNPEAFGTLQIWGDKRMRGFLPEEEDEDQPKAKVKFDPKNAQHMARFEQLDREHGGNSRMVNAELAKEFTL